MPGADQVITLGIETSNPSASGRGSKPAGSVALAAHDAASARGFRLLGLRSLRPRARHDDALMPAIEALCQSCGAAPSDIARIAVSIGPGGFTGLRIAVTTARFIAESVDAELIAAPSALVAAMKRKRLRRFVVLLAGKRDTAWATRFEFDDAGARLAPADAAAEGRIVDLDALRALREGAGFNAIVADRHMPAPMRAWAEDAGVPIVPTWLGAARCIEAAAGLTPVDRLALAPLYPREPEAVSKWRERR